MADLTPLWYAVRTRSRFEAAASAALRRKGITEFFPTYRSRRRWSDRVKELDLPLFPGYIFCRIDATNPLPVLSSPGVVHIVSMGSKPVAVEESEIEAVRTICAAGVPSEPCGEVTQGQRLSILRGPLKGLEGTLLKVMDKRRLVVSISLLQRSVAAELERDWISGSSN